MAIIPTMRKYLFLKWLYQRKKGNYYCNLADTDIECFNCLKQNEKCQSGLIPASFFYKKLGKQYFDCKRVLDSMMEEQMVLVHTLEGNNYRVFYEITSKGVEYIDKFEKDFWVDHLNSRN